MLVTLLGIVILVRPLQPLNDAKYINLVVLGIVKFVIEVSVTPANTRYRFLLFPRYFPLLYSVYLRLVQSPNTLLPMLVTLFGIVILVRLEQ